MLKNGQKDMIKISIVNNYNNMLNLLLIVEIHKQTSDILLFMKLPKILT